MPLYLPNSYTCITHTEKEGKGVRLPSLIAQWVSCLAKRGNDCILLNVCT